MPAYLAIATFLRPKLGEEASLGKPLTTEVCLPFATACCWATAAGRTAWTAGGNAVVHNPRLKFLGRECEVSHDD